MMNKAEKREIEVVTLRSLYNYCEESLKYHKTDVETYEEYMKNHLEENPNYDCSYYMGQIEQSKTHIETYKKVQEMIYKMM